MTEISSFEEVIDERKFAGILQSSCEVYFRLANTLRARAEQGWNRKHYFQLYNETDALESFLDDYGARVNRTYNTFRELVASLRGFSQAGHSITHLSSRLDSYGVLGRLGAEDAEDFQVSIRRVGAFIRLSVVEMLGATFEESDELGMEVTPAVFPEQNFAPVHARQRLPRNIDEEEARDECQKIAEIASKYLQACDVLRDLRVRRIDNASERAQYLTDVCTEEQARVYEATVHNLQSSYDTYLKNTVLEAQDERLSQLRGHISAALHTLQAVTHLTHFHERHENDIRSEGAQRRISSIVHRAEVQEMVLNHLLYWADRLLDQGRRLALAILPEYTNAQELEVELRGNLVLHARPAALIVGIVNHFGTPVEMEVAGQRCNAASILELLVTVGSHPDERKFVFRGDENPLRDIGLLFQYGLGEEGIENLPSDLSYLRAN